MWNSILKGINVLDLSSVLAGPLTGSFFAECGAKVVKVENEKTAGDVTRTWRTAGELPSSISAYYAAANYGKEVLLLDRYSRGLGIPLFDRAGDFGVLYFLTKPEL